MLGDESKRTNDGAAVKKFSRLQILLAPIKLIFSRNLLETRGAGDGEVLCTEDGSNVVQGQGTTSCRHDFGSDRQGHSTVLP